MADRDGFSRSHPLVDRGGSNSAVDTSIERSEVENYQPQVPIVGAFFYPWFPSAWNQQGADPFTNYTPEFGFYSSTDDSVIDKQIALASKAGVDAMISSWWGQGDDTDSALQHIMTRSLEPSSPQPRLRFAIYYEAEGSADPTVEEILGDLTYLKQTFFERPNYLRVAGKPVVFVSADSEDAGDMAARWAEAKRRASTDLFLVLKVYPGYRTDPNQPDSWHQYAPAESVAQTEGSISISPGFWKFDEEPRLERDPRRFEDAVVEMLNASVDFYLITTWNEWGEGTAVEPSEEFGDTYLGLLCRHLTDDNTCDSLSSKDPVLIGAGDIADCREPSSETATLIQQAARRNSTIAVMAIGDTAYESGTAEEFARCYEPTWGAFKDMTHPAVGNHEYETRGAAGYFGYFGAAAGNPDGGYYSYDLGAWHIVVLNSNCEDVGCEVGSPQEVWLRQDLAENSAFCTLAYWHHPLFSSGEHGDNPEVFALWQALEEAGAELVISGHDHNYERFAPQTSEGIADIEAGIVQFVVGTGGKDLRDVGNPKANSEVVGRDVYGVLELALHSDSYDWQFVPTADNFRDSGSGQCH
jgi:Glycosyl hydrolase family 99/Calcineurin-like phosphoesterase/Glycosyltransferase WbsX